MHSQRVLFPKPASLDQVLTYEQTSSHTRYIQPHGDCQPPRHVQIPPLFCWYLRCAILKAHKQRRLGLLDELRRSFSNYFFASTPLQSLSSNVPMVYRNGRCRGWSFCPCKRTFRASSTLPQWCHYIRDQWLKTHISGFLLNAAAALISPNARLVPPLLASNLDRATKNSLSTGASARLLFNKPLDVAISLTLASVSARAQ